MTKTVLTVVMIGALSLTGGCAGGGTGDSGSVHASRRMQTRTYAVSGMT